MPMVNLYLSKGKSKEEKRTLMNDTVESISRATGTDVNRIYVFICETEPENITIDAPVMTVSWAETPTRTPEAKKQIMAEMSGKLAQLTGAPLENVVVTFTDLPLTNVALGGIARG